MVIIEYRGHYFSVQQDNEQVKYHICDFFFFSERRLHFLTWGMATKGNTREEKE